MLKVYINMCRYLFYCVFLFVIAVSTMLSITYCVLFRAGQANSEISVELSTIITAIIPFK
jgi:hypothetical protein